LVAIFVYDHNFMISCDEFQKLTYDDHKMIIGYNNSWSYD